MASRNRFVLFALLGFTGLCGLVFTHAAQWAFELSGWANPMLFGVRQLQATTLVGFGVSVLLSTLTMQVATTRQFADEVADELLRISWPSREETSHATVVVIGCVLFCAAFLGLFDSAWLVVSTWLLGGAPNP